MDTKLTTSHQYALLTKKTKGILGCTSSIVASRLRKVTFPLYSALMRPHLEQWVQCWPSEYNRDMDLLEQVL